MRGLSFRWFFGLFVPTANRCKRALLAGVVLATVACGSDHEAHRTVEGTGYTFSAPASWSVVRSQRQVQAVAGKHSLELVAVSRFALLHAFHPDLWPKVVGELDQRVDQLARQQAGSIIESRTVTISGQRARRYDVAYDLRGKKLVERFAFVLRGTTEYQLLCRHEQRKPSDACDTLLRTFRLV
jgi:hypothetical protein